MKITRIMLAVSSAKVPLFAADFPVAQREVPSWPEYHEGVCGNKAGSGGPMGGLAVYDWVLTTDEICSLFEATRTPLGTD